MLKADNGVAKSDGGDVGGTWLQLVCCTLPKHLCPYFTSGLRTENIRGGWSLVRGAILEMDEERLSWRL